LVRQCLPIPQKIYKITKNRLQTLDEDEKYFPGFMAFIYSTTEQQKYHGLQIIKEERCIIQARREDILL
jgi:hypothetical protein